MRFQQKPSHVSLGDVWHDPDNRDYRREEDHYLYFDSESGAYFVVEDIVHVSGPNVSCDQFVRDAKDYVRRYPDLAEVVEKLIAAHKERSGVAGRPTAE